MRNRWLSSFALIATALGSGAEADAAFEFFVGNGADPKGNDAFIASVSGSLVIDSLEAFENKDPICALTVVGIDVNLLDADGNDVSDCGECFASTTIDLYCDDDPADLLCASTLLNRIPGTFTRWPQMELAFDEPLEAFGLWVFDDDPPTQQHFVLHAWDSAGNHGVSPVLDNPDSQVSVGWWVEGFVGVRSESGITRVVLQQIIDEGPPAYFEVDNLHVAPLGCPADVNGDGELDVLDFVAFQLLWQDQDPSADCDANAEFNVLDFVCFQLLFVAGCE